MPDALTLRLEYARQYQCADILSALEATYTDIARLEQQRATYSHDVSNTKRTLDDMQTIATLSIEGKNGEERKARLAEYLQKDADYQRMVQHYNNLQDHEDTAELAMNAAERKMHFLEYKLRYNMAMLRVVGGGE